ncbi:hypothetical protein E0W68_09735 [Flavobacterium salilacus subsp. salilacus]|uniref:hypothetical protein n=1 Tax=Flavobacterium TaxID=237 RepID=UPI00107572C9|nr:MULTISPECIES: hypothetical protein [Flavobacterium]KAF2518293.1 hypothetical protein E0W68_09735 [Flavobacterium salilacus subsp. salilacus]MBE1615293.1 hypothetical protein [Flavobacterium sp. SaA2.13]
MTNKITSKEIESKPKQIRKFFYRHLPWVFTIISILIFWIVECNFFTLKFNSILEKFGIAIFSSGVFAAVLKSIQFTGLFKEEIEKVMLGADFLKNRSDLPVLWRKISQTIYKSRFPKISEELENRILNTYFPTSTEYYYEDYIVTINIDEIDENFVISYTQTCKYNVILDKDLNGTNIILKTAISQLDEASKPINDLIFFKVNGEDLNPKEDQATLDDEDAKKFTIPLTGNGPFKVHSKFKRKYSLKGENYKLFRMNTFTRNMDVTISYPPHVCVSFFNIGNVNFFEKNHTEIKNLISRSHRNDVILPYQGFGMSFERNNINVKSE